MLVVGFQQSCLQRGHATGSIIMASTTSALMILYLHHVKHTCMGHVCMRLRVGIMTIIKHQFNLLHIPALQSHVVPKSK